MDQELPGLEKVGRNNQNEKGNICQINKTGCSIAWAPASLRWKKLSIYADRRVTPRSALWLARYQRPLWRDKVRVAIQSVRLITSNPRPRCCDCGRAYHMYEAHWLIPMLFVVAQPRKCRLISDCSGWRRLDAITKMTKGETDVESTKPGAQSHGRPRDHCGRT